MAASSNPAFKAPWWRPVAKTKNYTIQGLDIKSAFTNAGATGAVTLQLPKAGNSAHTQAGGPGLEYMFLCAVNQTITVTPVTGDTIRGKATSASATNATAGSLLWLVCLVPGFWEPVVNNGGW